MVSSTAGAVLAGSYAVSGTTVTFTPLTALPGSTIVFVAVPVNGLQDLSGNKNVSVNFSSSFPTASVTDTMAPQVVATPNNGATGIGLNATVVLTFSKSVNPNTMYPLLRDLEARGLVTRDPDARDGRRIVLDVHGAGRKGLTVADLVQMFRKVRDDEIVEDQLLLA